MYLAVGDILCFSMTELQHVQQCFSAIYSQQFSRCGQLTAQPYLMPVDALHVRTPKGVYLRSPSKDY
jgi:hypothetical protein